MAGGPSTPALTAAIADAGGYGFVAAGYLSAKGLHEAIATTRTLTAETSSGVIGFPPRPWPQALRQCCEAYLQENPQIGKR
jgi:nitronate monooxygenase